jgi:Tfp pilus assembly protein PilF
VCKDRGALDPAVEYYRKALELKPDAAEVCCNLGSVFEQRRTAAASSHRRAIKPDHAPQTGWDRCR